MSVSKVPVASRWRNSRTTTPKTVPGRPAPRGGRRGARPKSNGRRVGGYGQTPSTRTCRSAAAAAAAASFHSNRPTSLRNHRVDINKILRKVRSKLRFVGWGVHGMVRKLRPCGDKAGVLCDKCGFTAR